MSEKSCKTLEPRVSALVDGELAAPERDEVESHLARCERCASVASGFRELRLRASGQAISPVEAGEWALFRERLARRIESGPRGSIITGGAFRRWVLIAAAALVLMGLAGAWMLREEPPRLESFAEWRSGSPPAEIEVNDETLYIKYEDF